jgi:UDP-N-acetylmuramoyl-L-alanyl-D-glutamate--2,6-diaminopimelate ligase
MSSVKDTLRKKLPAVAGAYHFLWAWTASKLHRGPSRNIFVIGVTGTKGKTTTLELLNAILEAAGKKTALLSSLRMKIGADAEKNRTGNSMPGRSYIQSFLRRAVRAGCGYALVEVTSQGVAMHRHQFIDWNIGALTNLAPEHIESHGSFEKYRGAKLAFLEYVAKKGGKIFLNADDLFFPFFAGALANMKTASYVAGGDAIAGYLQKVSPMRGANASATPVAAKFLLSDFNKSNIACAAAIAKELGIGDTTIQEAIANFEGVPGRVNMIVHGDYTAIVDYAHTPDSLEAVYRAVKPKRAENGERRAADSAPRLICVLGACGGGRDVWKRPEFGKIAAKYCDEVIITEEDPYDENPDDIAAQIKSGITDQQFLGAHVYEIPNRRDAIQKAVTMLWPHDVVIGTGKGSEEWIHYARGKKSPWNEKEEFEKALAEKANSK